MSNWSSGSPLTDARMDGRSKFIDVTEPIAGLSEAGWKISHDQHPLGIRFVTGGSWTWRHQPTRVEKPAYRVIEIIGIRDHTPRYQPTLQLLLRALRANTQRPDHVIDERSNPGLIR
jgi:hypothetical protein